MSRLWAALWVSAVAILFLCAFGLSAQERGAGQQGQGRRAGAGGPGGPPPARQEPARSTRIEFPPLFFREDWKINPNAPNVNNAEEPEQPITQGNVANPNLEVHVYGDQPGSRISDQTYNNHLTYAMTLLCTSACAITVRDKNNDVDLSGAATIRWRTRISGFRYLHPIVKLADGTWLIGDKATTMSTAWIVSEIQLVDVRWRRFDPKNVIETGDGYWVDYPDLSRVEEVGFTDLMRGAGHGSAGGSRLDWIEVYGKPVPRNGSGTKGNEPSAQAAPQTAPQSSDKPANLFLSASQLSDLIAKAKSERKPNQPIVIEPILELGGYDGHLEYRASVGNAALHETEAELFYVIDGSATLNTGGQLVNEKRTDAANLNGSAIEGGAQRQIAKGDWILVPQNTPHWFSPIHGVLVLYSMHVPGDFTPRH